mmetsp:Transcript_28431/g.69209  ORF Transcript_28431/g.69209 Transcript_28431/m.69209 type:complete len:223 (-) Transcript_28431:512-1180(-)
MIRVSQWDARPTCGSPISGRPSHEPLDAPAQPKYSAAKSCARPFTKCHTSSIAPSWSSTRFSSISSFRAPVEVRAYMNIELEKPRPCSTSCSTSERASWMFCSNVLALSAVTEECHAKTSHNGRPAWSAAHELPVPAIPLRPGGFVTESTTSASTPEVHIAGSTATFESSVQSAAHAALVWYPLSESARSNRLRASSKTRLPTTGFNARYLRRSFVTMLVTI